MTTSQPLLDAIANVWRLTIRGYLPLCDLPRVSLLKDSLVRKEPSLLRGVDGWARSLLSLDLGELLVLMRHASYVTLSRE